MEGSFIDGRAAEDAVGSQRALARGVAEGGVLAEDHDVTVGALQGEGDVVRVHRGRGNVNDARGLRVAAQGRDLSSQGLHIHRERAQAAL